MKMVAWLSVIVWAISLWFLYPLPFQEIEIIERIQGTSEGVEVEVWTRWAIVTSYVLLGLYASIRFFLDGNRSTYLLVALSLVYLGYFLIHFYRAALAFDVSLLGAFTRQWERAVSLEFVVAKLGFLHAYVVLPIGHLVIAIILISIMYQKRQHRTAVAP